MAGLRVLVAEDYWLLANDYARVLRAQDTEVVGPVPTLADALRLVGQGRRWTLPCSTSVSATRCPIRLRTCSRPAMCCSYSDTQVLRGKNAF
jgi:hypothetical protein